MSIKITEAFVPHPDKVFVTDIESGPLKTQSGLIIPDDNMQNRGIRPRWAQVYAIGANITDVAVGEWIFLEHGRWGFGIDLELPTGDVVRVWHADFPNGSMMASTEDPRANQKTVL
jgi:co-chaperonin GroES (HSP10)